MRKPQSPRYKNKIAVSQEASQESQPLNCVYFQLHFEDFFFFLSNEGVLKLLRNTWGLNGVPCLSNWSWNDLICSDSHLQEDSLCTRDSPLPSFSSLTVPHWVHGVGGRNPAKFLDLLFSQWGKQRHVTSLKWSHAQGTGANNMLAKSPSTHIRRIYTALTAQALSIKFHVNSVYKDMISHSASGPYCIMVTTFRVCLHST